jgi:hypothetical protein
MTVSIVLLCAATILLVAATICMSSFTKEDASSPSSPTWFIIALRIDCWVYPDLDCFTRAVRVPGKPLLFSWSFPVHDGRPRARAWRGLAHGRLGAQKTGGVFFLDNGSGTGTMGAHARAPASAT